MIEPMFDRVILRRLEGNEKELASGIILTGLDAKLQRDYSKLQAKGPHRLIPAQVVAMGPGKENRPLTELELGDKVYLSWKAGSEVEFEGEYHIIARYDEIEALIEEDDAELA
jgi:co-chaperonin GroES (HSP10)